jgi:hypothetical protein
MHDERALLILATKRIQTGDLPGQAPNAIWAGKGDDHPCALCGKCIPCNEVEYEMRDTVDRVFRFHLRCHGIWQLASSGDAERVGNASV